MKTKFHTKITVLAAAAALLISSCTSMRPQSGTTRVSGLTCDKCEAIWLPTVAATGKPGSGYHTYRMSRKMVCPDCENIMATFMRTGKFSHSCPSCGGQITRCTAQMAHAQTSASKTR